jgi:hypothetical protein
VSVTPFSMPLSRLSRSSVLALNSNISASAIGFLPCQFVNIDVQLRQELPRPH